MIQLGQILQYKSPLTSCTLLTIWNASGLKAGVPCTSQSLQRQTGFKVRILAYITFKSFITKVPEY